MFTSLQSCPHTRARRGRLQTAHGVVQTPVFMSVGTQGAVKAVLARDLEEMGADIILGNTYHLMLRPGLEGMRRLGGLHKFINWHRPILTDSGGFQVFSLAKIRKVTETGVEFRSHIDGSLLWLGPKEAIEMQQAIGSDIMMVLDECPPWDCGPALMQQAIDRTVRWAGECFHVREARVTAGNHGPTPRQLLFAIVQGGHSAELRRQCAEQLQRWDFDGFAIGGVSVGEPENEMFEAVAHAAPHLPANKPRYVMGLGHPHQMVEMVAQGIDMFDCVLPTRMARHGSVYTTDGLYDLRHAKYQFDERPLEEGCACQVCRRYSRAYLRHLIKAHEINGMVLVSLHNTFFYLNLFAQIRSALEANAFEQFRSNFVNRFKFKSLP